MKKLVLVLACLTLLMGRSESEAGLQLPNIFGDHMVLQRDQKVPVWGWADEDELVIVQFRDQVVQLKLSEMHMLTEALRSFVMRVAAESDDASAPHSAHNHFLMNFDCFSV